MLGTARSIAAFLIVVLCTAGVARAQTDPSQVITRAAEALGGADRIQALRTMRFRGYGHDPYQDGGSLITTELTAPEKMTIITAYERAIDLANGRTRVRAKQSRAFVFAAEAMMTGRPIDQRLDGDVAFDVAPGGAARRASKEAATQRRMELLANPIVAVRAALDSRSRVTNRRTEGAATLVDVTTAASSAFTLAVTTATGLPLWVRWVGPHENLGDITYRTEFSGYEPVNGVWVPMSFNTVSDWRNNVQQRLHVDRWVLDGDVGDLAAPAAVRSASDAAPTYTVDATPVAAGVWFLSGNGGANSVLLEFADHLTLFEVPTNRAWTAALIAKARSTVPGKPVTEAITSHHHFDHTGGLRTAIAEGLTIVTQSGNVAWFEELARRQVTAFPDALSRSPRPLKTTRRRRPSAPQRFEAHGRRLSRRVQQPHGARPHGVPARASLADPGRPVRFELGGLLLGQHVRGQRRVSQARRRARRADSRSRAADRRSAREARRADTQRRAALREGRCCRAVDAGLSARLGGLTARL